MSDAQTQRHRVVTVFGGGTVARGTPAYEDARRLGRLLAQAGLAVATGGYGGVMEAASRGACEAQGHVIGVTCDRIEQVRHVRVNEWVQERMHFVTLRDRLYRLIEIADVLVAMPGGIGTLGEIAASWNGLQTGELPARPFVLVGPGWRRVLETFTAEMSGNVAQPDIARLTFAADVDEAARLVVNLLRR